MQRDLCVCVRDEKSWNIESKDTKNIYCLIRKVLFLNKKKKSWNIELNETKIQYLIGLIFNTFCIKCVTWQVLVLSHMSYLPLNSIYLLFQIIVMTLVMFVLWKNKEDCHFLYIITNLYIYIYIYICKWF